MSNKGKYWDNAPFIPYSGKTTALEGVSVDNSIRQDLYFQPSTITPDEIKKYRDSTRQRVGVKQYHPGIYDDPKDYEDLVHGVPTKSSLHVDDCIKGTNLSGNQIFMNQLIMKIICYEWLPSINSTQKEGPIVFDFEKPKIEIAEISEDKKYGRFVVEPLERGYGTTLGNSLRRIMLSSLPGAAVSQVKIDGVLHQSRR